jgi:hypothetical protein
MRCEPRGECPHMAPPVSRGAFPASLIVLPSSPPSSKVRLTADAGCAVLAGGRMLGLAGLYLAGEAAALY